MCDGSCGSAGGDVVVWCCGCFVKYLLLLPLLLLLLLLLSLTPHLTPPHPTPPHPQAKLVTRIKFVLAWAISKRPSVTLNSSGKRLSISISQVRHNSHLTGLEGAAATLTHSPHSPTLHSPIAHSPTAHSPQGSQRQRSMPPVTRTSTLQGTKSSMRASHNSEGPIAQAAAAAVAQVAAHAELSGRRGSVTVTPSFSKSFSTGQIAGTEDRRLSLANPLPLALASATVGDEMDSDPPTPATTTARSDATAPTTPHTPHTPHTPTAPAGHSTTTSAIAKRGKTGLGKSKAHATFKKAGMVAVALTKDAPSSDTTSLSDPPTASNSQAGRSSTPTTLRVTLKTGKILTLTNRSMMPYYKIDDISRFCEIFAAADQNSEGELDINEWEELFSKINKDASVQQARLIFMRFDENMSGSLSLGELIPVVFSKGTKAQMKLIEQYAGALLISDHAVEEPTFSIAEAEQLFDAYDPETVNFVTVGLIRDRVRLCYKLPETVHYQFLLPIEQIADDEMFSRVEFYRFMKPFITNDKK